MRIYTHWSLFPTFHSFLDAGVRYANLKNANYFLNIWILLTFALSIMDLCLGIAFGIDYDTLRVSIFWAMFAQNNYLFITIYSV